MAQGRLLAGAIVAGKYRIVGCLGSGGMGAVYRAEHLRVGQHVAIKMLSQELANQQEFALRFEREARAAGKLRSLHAVRVHDVDVADGVPFIVMEYLEGNDLHVESSRREIAPGELIAWILQACAAIGEAHSCGIVHRDLKPANLFIADIEGARIAKVLDFGVSKFEGDVRLTGTGHTLGTPQYMSPEQIRGHNVDGLTDVYAIGVILYKLLAKRLPFVAGEAFEYAAGLGAPPTGLDVLRPDLPMAFCSLVMRTFARDRAARPPIDALAVALRPYATGRGVLRISVGTTPPAVPRIDARWAEPDPGVVTAPITSATVTATVRDVAPVPTNTPLMGSPKTVAESTLYSGGATRSMAQPSPIDRQEPAHSARATGVAVSAPSRSAGARILGTALVVVVVGVVFAYAKNNGPVVGTPAASSFPARSTSFAEPATPPAPSVQAASSEGTAAISSVQRSGAPPPGLHVRRGDARSSARPSATASGAPSATSGARAVPIHL